MSAIEYASPINLNQFEIQNPRMQNLAANPLTPVEGQYHWSTATKKIMIYNGTAYESVNNYTASELLTLLLTVDGGASGLDAQYLAGQDGSYYLSRGNHSGTQLASTISDFNAEVQTNRLDQMAAPTASVSMGNQKITNLANPTSSTDAATKGYTDLIAQGFTQKATATVATAAALPSCSYDNGVSGLGATLTGDADGALTVDGYVVEDDDIVLVRLQASAEHNGLYVVTQAGDGGSPFILTRHTQMDTAAEFRGAFIPVEDEGTTLKNTLWLCENTEPPVVGTDDVTFTHVNAATSMTAGTGIDIAGNTISIDDAYTGQVSIDTLGTITTGEWQGTSIAIAHGGTGATDAAGARANLGAIGKYTALIGDGSTNPITVPHATHLQAPNSTNSVQVRDAVSGARIEVNYTVDPSTGDVEFDFGIIPTSNQYRIVISG